MTPSIFLQPLADYADLDDGNQVGEALIKKHGPYNHQQSAAENLLLDHKEHAQKGGDDGQQKQHPPALQAQLPQGKGPFDARSSCL